MDEGHASVPDGEDTPTASFGTRRRSRSVAGALFLTATVALGGCGSSTSLLTSSSSSTTRTTGTTGAAGGAARSAGSARPLCSPAARADVAGAASVSPGAVGEKEGTSSEATPQCVFRAGKLTVVAIVDSGPQAYFRLERTVVEAEQQFSAVRLEPAPVHVGGLGLDADWFPREKQIMTTDGNRLITVSVSWPGVPEQRQIGLAKVIARTYLGPNNPKAADPNGS